MLGIVMSDSDPLQPCLEAGLDLLHQMAGMLLKVHAFAELWRHDDLEHPLITFSLPVRQALRDVHGIFRGTEPDSLGVAFLGSAIARDVVSMCPPLPECFIRGIGHANGTALVKLSTGAMRATEAGTSRASAGHLNDAQQVAQARGPGLIRLAVSTS